MTNQNKSEVRTFSPEFLVRFGEFDNVYMKESDSGEYVLKSDYDKLKEENQRLRDEVEFVKQYLDPADTSFRQMIDAFKCLPKEKQEKLIDLSRSLVNIGHGDGVFCE